MSNGHCSDIVEESAVESRNARANRRNQVVEYTEEPEQPEEDIPDDVDIESLQPSANLKENGIRKSKGTPKAEISPLKVSILQQFLSHLFISSVNGAIHQIFLTL